MDPLINKLNQQITEKVKNKTVNVPADGGVQKQSFEQVLQDKRAEQVNLSEINNDSKPSEMRAFSADDIQVNFANAETGASSDFDPKKKFYSMFESLNSDMISLDASLEVLANPDVKLSKRQLLAYQAGIGNMTINSELFSRLAQTVAQNLNTLLQTNIG